MANAANASTVDGLNASDLKVTSAGTINAAPFTLPVTYTAVASAEITTQAAGRILATGSAELDGSDTDERGQCKLVIDGTGGVETETTFDDIGTSNEAVVSLDFQVTRPAGTYTASVQCLALSGTVNKDDASINLWGVPG